LANRYWFAAGGRTVAVFAIKYLRSFGFKVENDMFASHSWYFRNALVRANFNDYQNKIYSTQEFLMQFFGNLLFGENNELKNRYLHIKSNNNAAYNSINQDVSVNVSVKDKILEIIRQHPKIRVKDLAEKLSVNERTVYRNLKKLKADNKIERIGADKNGLWKMI
jgi:hypothetical protein